MCYIEDTTSRQAAVGADEADIKPVVTDTSVFCSAGVTTTVTTAALDMDEGGIAAEETSGSDADVHPALDSNRTEGRSATCSFPAAVRSPSWP